ncbi:oxygen-independent coproporphyrinogen III oxidase [Pelagibius sp. Alg239-R121]|uniref:oxygen-independent coproporphyrinogen III oxidase n=1 Tax=Pelagibius sp. Alg239-R121 TaxID=2993448 RepID=UPI0024A7463F|nr:oxygen-independent coproporphyrinogen III oxidase [Pelagibius sp. Alg239-R121]
MDQILAKYRDARLPRYTSYPTAPHFTPDITASDYTAWLGAVGPDQKLSLYLHIPFCSQMCWYCGCHTKVVNNYAPVASYVALLRREIEMLAAALPVRREIGHIHWGGGTPNLLSDEDFAGLMALLREHFDLAPDAEVAVEVDPRRLGKTQARALAAAGVNRASLGVQDFNSDVQEAINRVQPFELVESCVADLRATGISSINFDLLYGLPGQDLTKLERNLRLSAALRPDRIALFGYAHVPWMKKHQRLIDETTLPDGPARVKQAAFSSKMLAWLGYVPVGLDHFALPDDLMAKALESGKLRRNFQGYTLDSAEVLIGLGVSAIGSLPLGYIQNNADFVAYAKAIREGKFAVARGRELSNDDRLRRRAIEELMCQGELDLVGLCEAGHITADSFDKELTALKPLIADGLARVDGRKITVTEQGRPLVRAICAVFDRYLEQSETRHSRAI